MGNLQKGMYKAVIINFSLTLQSLWLLVPTTITQYRWFETAKLSRWDGEQNVAQITKGQ